MNRLSAGFFFSLLIPGSAAIYYCAKLVQIYPHLAASIPVHFDFHGSPNSWMSKSIWAPLSLAILLAMLLGVPSTLRAANLQHGSWVAPLTYSGAYGLLIGAFLELLFAAQSKANLRFFPLLAWTVAVTAGQGFILFLDSYQ